MSTNRNRVLATLLCAVALWLTPGTPAVSGELGMDPYNLDPINDLCEPWVSLAEDGYSMRKVQLEHRTPEEAKQFMYDLWQIGDYGPTSAGYHLYTYILEQAFAGADQASMMAGTLALCRRYDPDYVSISGDAHRDNPKLRRTGSKMQDKS